jgi:hypothetical protein
MGMAKWFRLLWMFGGIQMRTWARFVVFRQGFDRDSYRFFGGASGSYDTAASNIESGNLTL